MATIYEIDFTDLNVNRAFQISAYTSDGPASPGSDTPLGTGATVANTSLLLTGKGFPNYGEIVAENFVHLLEHFSNATEPSYPISGQLWYDTSGDWDDPQGSPSVGLPGTPVMRVFNAAKHMIMANHPTTPDAASSGTITIPGNFETRFQGGKRIRTYDIATGDQTEYIINSGSPSTGIDPNGNTYFFISPVPGGTLVGLSTVGGWDRIMQENSSFLTQNMSASDPVTGTAYKITDLLDPDNDQDAATKKYVDDAIFGVNSLAALSDVSLSVLSDNNFLAYNAFSGFWENQTAAQVGVLALIGGTMTGPLMLFADPILPSMAATKNYVDLAVTLGSVSELDDLSDVTITGPIGGNSLMTYNSGAFQWENTDPITWFNLYSVMRSTLTQTMGVGAQLFLSQDPVAPFEAATKNYVDTITTDSYVNMGTFDGVDQKLILNVIGQADVDIVGWSDLEVGANQLAYVLPLPTTFQRRAWYLEQAASDSQLEYPLITGSQIFSDMNESLGNMSKPRDRAVFDADGLSTVDTSADGAYGDLHFDYVPGYSKLQVYEDGLKRIASEHGWLRVACDVPVGSPLPTINELWNGFPTGLLNATLYDFTIQLNTGGATDSGAIVVTVDGSGCQTLGQLVDTLNFWADVNLHDFGDGYLVPPFGVQMFDGVIVFYSSYPGIESYVNLTDGGGANTDLFVSIVGATIPAGSYTYSIDPSGLDVGERNDGMGSPLNGPAPRTWHYREIGRVGRASYIFEWESGSVPGGSPSSVIEIISDHDLLYEQTLQP